MQDPVQECPWRLSTGVSMLDIAGVSAHPVLTTAFQRIVPIIQMRPLRLRDAEGLSQGGPDLPNSQATLFSATKPGLG